MKKRISLTLILIAIVCIAFFALPARVDAAGIEDLYYKEVVLDHANGTWKIDPEIHLLQDRPYWRNVGFSLVFCDSMGNELEGKLSVADPSICTVEDCRGLNGACEIWGVAKGSTELTLMSSDIVYKATLEVIGEELMAYPVRVDEKGEYTVMGGLQMSLDDWDLEAGRTYLMALGSSYGMLREGLEYSSYNDEVCTITYKKDGVYEVQAKSAGSTVLYVQGSPDYITERVNGEDYPVDYSGTVHVKDADPSGILKIEGTTLRDLNRSIHTLATLGGTSSKVEIILNGEYGLDGDENRLWLAGGLSSSKAADAVRISGNGNATIHGFLWFEDNGGYVVDGVRFVDPDPGSGIATSDISGEYPISICNCTFHNYSIALSIERGNNLAEDLRIEGNTFIGSKEYDIIIHAPGNYYFPGNSFFDAEGKTRNPIAYLEDDICISFGPSAASSFTFDASTGTITEFTGTDPVVTIPSEIDGVSVRAIGPLDMQKFIKSIWIPASVKEIDPTAFAFCWNMVSIVVDPDNPSYMSEDGVLFSKDRKILVRYPRGKSGAYTIPGWVERIGKNSFADAFDVTSVIVLDGVTAIEVNAFNNTNITEITLPKTLKTIEKMAFDYNETLTDIYYAGSKSDWLKIEIYSGNDILQNATIHYNSESPVENMVTKTLRDSSGKTVKADVSLDWGTVDASGNISADAPVLVASYDENGRFLGVSVLTSPAKTSTENGSETAKLIWLDGKAFTPRTGAEEVLLK